MTNIEPMNTTDLPPEQKITAVILGGGRARRMGGHDKGLLRVQGKPMIEYVIEVLKPQVTQILINANRSLDRYKQYGYPVVMDIIGEYYGPLAGMVSG